MTILLNELRKYNPELLDKKRILAISKMDMLDDELLQEMKKEVPDEIPAVFISVAYQQRNTGAKRSDLENIASITCRN